MIPNSDKTPSEEGSSDAGIMPRSVPGMEAVSSQWKANTQEKPYYSKRPHKKSRSGCHNCKTRKVKCDETRPRCRACTIRHEICVYSPPAAGPVATRTAVTPFSSPLPKSGYTTNFATFARYRNVAPVTASDPKSGSSSNLLNYQQGRFPGFPSASSRLEGGLDGFLAGVNGFSLVDQPLFVPVQIDSTDMNLLWFFTAKGFDALSGETGRVPFVNEILQVNIPRLAFANRFLMDSLLALAALELQMIGQPIEPTRVITYRARAVSGYRTSVENAHPEIYPALLACSLILCALSSQTFRDAEGPPLYIVDWMIVWRGIGLIVNLIQPKALFESGMAPLFVRPFIDLDASANHIPNHLLFMVSSTKSGEPDFSYVDVYYETLKYLGSLYRELVAGLGRMLNMRTVTWLTFLPKEFVSLCRQRQPRALIIIAHYLMFVKLCKTIWWLDNIAQKEIRAIRNVVDDGWLPLLRVPIEALKIDDRMQLRKLILENNMSTSDGHCENHHDAESQRMAFVDDHGYAVEYHDGWVRTKSGVPAVWHVDRTP